MTNKEFIKHLEYQERIMRELHGIKVALPFKVALEAARAAIDGTKHDTKCKCGGDWSRATGAAPVVENRDNW